MRWLLAISKAVAVFLVLAMGYLGAGVLAADPRCPARERADLGGLLCMAAGGNAILRHQDQATATNRYGTPRRICCFRPGGLCV